MQFIGRDGQSCGSSECFEGRGDDELTSLQDNELDIFVY